MHQGHVIDRRTQQGAASAEFDQPVALHRPVKQRIDFPKCCSLGPKCSVWVEAEVNAWIFSPRRDAMDDLAGELALPGTMVEIHALRLVPCLIESEESAPLGRPFG